MSYIIRCAVRVYTYLRHFVSIPYARARTHTRANIIYISDMAKLFATWRDKASINHVLHVFATWIAFRE